MRRNGIRVELDYGLKEESLLETTLRHSKNRLEAADDPIQLAAFDPGDTSEAIYRTAFTTVKNGDPDYYGDAIVNEMM